MMENKDLYIGTDEELKVTQSEQGNLNEEQPYEYLPLRATGYKTESQLDRMEEKLERILELLEEVEQKTCSDKKYATQSSLTQTAVGLQAQVDNKAEQLDSIGTRVTALELEISQIRAHVEN